MSACRRRSATPSCRKSPTCWWSASARRQEGKVAVRLRSGKDLGAMPLETFVARIKEEAETRKDLPE